MVVESIKQFCLSKYSSFTEFSNNEATELTSPLISLCEIYLEKMETGVIECTHDFYLKFFHLSLLNNLIEYKPFDFILIDEIGDINEVTLEIFKLLPAKIKIGVGDACQNIYGFNHTINAFIALKDNSKLFNMSKSFRVSKDIATKIETFGKKYLDHSMIFEGVDKVDPTIKTRAFLSRTNGALVGKIMECEKAKVPFKLMRKAEEIFKLPLTVSSFKYQGSIIDKSYSFLQSDIDNFYEEILPIDNKANLLFHLAKLHSHDISLGSAIKLIQRHGKKDVYSAYEYAKKQESLKSDGLVLATAHSVKGSEYDEVTIGDDLNEVVENILLKTINYKIEDMSVEDLNELNLAYVAASRARVRLNNAKFLEM